MDALPVARVRSSYALRNLLAFMHAAGHDGLVHGNAGPAVGAALGDLLVGADYNSTFNWPRKVAVARSR